MKGRALWKLSVATSAEAEEAVAEWLAGAYGQPAGSFTDMETGATTVAVYLPEKPNWSRAVRAGLKAGLERIRGCGLQIAPGRVWLAKVRRENWAESWKRHFGPMEIGRGLLIKPSWSRRRARKGQAVVVLDPGLSFGTGRHPTTAFCLRQLAARRRPGTAQSFLDLGTGSGILAIAAVRLGYGPVEGLDFDPEAVRVARANARRNGVSGRVRFLRRDVTRLPGRAARKHSLICANLITPLLERERDRILARLAPEGVLVLAGILKGEFSQVQAAYEAAGLRLVASRAEKEWRSGSFVWRKR